jgi:phosphoglycerate dehydrogenase-like enzyme
MDEANDRALRSFADVVIERDQDTALSPNQMADRLRGCSAILSLNGQGSEDITADVLTTVGTVRVICVAHSWGQFATIAGTAGVAVVEGSNAGTAAVAEWIVTAALMGVRKLHLFDRALKGGSPWGEPRRSVGLLSGSLVGMVGLGRIGRYAARHFRALCAQVIAFSASCPPSLAESLGVRLVSLDELLRTSDIISLNHRTVDVTRHELGASELGKIKAGCVFINAARAALYDEPALIAELKTGRFSAYLDVFEHEPIPLTHPFRSMNNVVITPHIAGNNAPMFQRCASEAIGTLRSYFEGKGLNDKRYSYP